MTLDNAYRCVERSNLLKNIQAWLISDEHGALVGVWDGEQLREFTRFIDWYHWYDWYLGKTRGAE